MKTHDIIGDLFIFSEYQVLELSGYVNRKCGGISDDAHSRGQIFGDFLVLQKVGILIIFSSHLCCTCVSES